MFYKGGEVISDQFDHLKVIGFGVLVVKFWIFSRQNGKFSRQNGKFSPEGVGTGVSSFP